MDWQARKRSAILRFGRSSRDAFNAIIGTASTIGDPARFDPSVFPWITDLQANLTTLQRELRHVLTRQELLPGVEEISPDHSRIALERRWRSFFLHAYGYRSAMASRICPETARLVDAVPGLETAFFSVLTPGAHLPSHRGVTKAIITCHLPLIVPADRAGCWIDLDGERHHWRVGEPFVFDDTRRHEVRNDTPDNRVVLLMHVRRPTRFPGSLAAGAFMGLVKKSPFVKDGVRNQMAWEQRFEEAFGRGIAQAPAASASPT